MSEILFNYLRDILYEPKKAKLNLADLEETDQKLGKGLMFLHDQLNEQRVFIGALSKGDLNVDPPKSNELTAPLKSLHANLKHLTWQTQQVAVGDYKQRVDFMGEFSVAFNEMTRQLEMRRRALEQDNKLLFDITSGIPQAIVVLSDDTGEALFMNPAAERLRGLDPMLLQQLQGEVDEISIREDDIVKFYTVKNYAVCWKDQIATAFVLDDISHEKEQIMELEQFAHYDKMTGARNRHAGMEILQQWIKEKRAFALGFVDLDNLKYVNDEMGHKEGDGYIVRASELLMEFGSGVIVSRIGGDEFMILMPDQTKEQADVRLEELREELIRITAELGKNYRGNISYGTVVYSDGVTASEMLSLADERMYTFKRRNKMKIGK